MRIFACNELPMCPMLIECDKSLLCRYAIRSNFCIDNGVKAMGIPNKSIGFQFCVFATVFASLHVGHISAQVTGQMLFFHVTSVRQAVSTTLCTQPDATCSATTYTVEGYSENNRNGTLVKYVLACDTVEANEPQFHVTMVCVQLHAGKDYVGTLVADSISFSSEKVAIDKSPLVVSYEILSESEDKKPLKASSKRD
jgi:hypothetical protein